MDLGSIVKTDETFTLHVKHPTEGHDLGVTIELRSQESDEVIAVNKQHADRALRRRGKPITTSQLEDQYLDAAVAAIVSWDWGEYDNDGKKPDLKDAKSILKKIGWLYDQINEASQDRANFTKA